MNKIKELICPVFISKNGKAVRDFTDQKVICEDPVSLAISYADAGSDGLLVFDLSETDEEHEQNLDLIQAICMEADVPVTGAGNVRRMEDIKKLIYAGCSKAALNMSKECGYEIIEEVSKKFGRDKIAVCYQEGKRFDRDSIGSFAKTIIALPSDMHGSVSSFDKYDIPDTELIVYLAEGSVEDIFKLLENNAVYAITGTGVDDKADSLVAIKQHCVERNIPINRLVPAFEWSDLKKDNDGHVTVVVQDYRTDQVLMVAYMNEEAYNMTIRTGRMTYFSRSRQELWIKGETSGHYQYVRSLTADCDLDTILAKVKQVGAACHTGSYSCFFNEIASRKYKEKNPQKVLDNLYDVICDRRINPREGSYTNYLFDKGIDKILKKCGEECTEIVIAAKNPNPNEIKYEIADFLYHMEVLMVEKGVTWEQITDELSKR